MPQSGDIVVEESEGLSASVSFPLSFSISLFLLGAIGSKKEGCPL